MTEPEFSDYQVVSELNSSKWEFHINVKSLLREGYVPYGNPFMSGEVSNKYAYYINQALVLRNPKYKVGNLID
jgi:hypothetical protein